MSVPVSLLQLGSVEGRPAALDAKALYREYFSFIWRLLRRLGVVEAALDDAVQDVFLVVHRKESVFDQRSTPKALLAGIAVRVAKDHRRALKRKAAPEPLSEHLSVADPKPQPDEQAFATQAIQLAQNILDAMDEEKRAVFVMAELEELSGPEIASVLGINLNTVYSRLRLARQIFENAAQATRGECL